MRNVEHAGERLGRRHAHEQRADEPRPDRHRDAVEVAEPDLRLVERLREQDVERDQVLARRQLGDDAPEARVQVGLRREQVRADASVLDDGHAGLVAGGFESEDDHPVIPIERRIRDSRSSISAEFTSSIHITSASSPVSA